MTDGDRAAGLQWAATAFYLVAVTHGLVLHRRSGMDAPRAWALVYATAMSVALAAGEKRGSGEDTRDARLVTVLLVAFYALLRLFVALRGPFEGDDHHLTGALAEASALLLAYALVSGSRIVRGDDKTQ